MRRPLDRSDARRRSTRPALAALGTFAALTLLIAGCSGSSKGAATKPATTTTKVGKGSVALTVSVAGVESGGQAANVADDAKAAITQAVDSYVQTATVRPMQSGKPAADISTLFTPAAAAHLATDLPAFVDNGLTTASGPITAKTANVVLTGLAQQDGSVVLINAGLTLDVGAKTKGGPESVQRNADLVFSNQNGAWKITGYDVQATRAAPGSAPSTTTAVSAK